MENGKGKSVGKGERKGVKRREKRIFSRDASRVTRIDRVQPLSPCFRFALWFRMPRRLVGAAALPCFPRRLHTLRFPSSNLFTRHARTGLRTLPISAFPRSWPSLFSRKSTVRVLGRPITLVFVERARCPAAPIRSICSMLTATNSVPGKPFFSYFWLRTLADELLCELLEYPSLVFLHGAGTLAALDNVCHVSLRHCL